MEKSKASEKVSMPQKPKRKKKIVTPEQTAPSPQELAPANPEPQPVIAAPEEQLPGDIKGRTGRPSKLTKKLLAKMLLAYRLGATDKQISELFEVGESRINEWKKLPLFRESVTRAKDETDDKVELMLLERAMGYSHPEEKIFCHEGEIVRAETRRQYPPDTEALKFWLKNRRPKIWRDKETDGPPQLAAINITNVIVTPQMGQITPEALPDGMAPRLPG